MLSVRRASCRPAAAALATAVLSVLLLAAGQGQASAQPTICWNEESGDLSYGCSEESGGGDGQDGGSGVMTCDIVTSESDACSHVYQRASGGDGYAARARLVYDVHFEQNGDPIEVAGMPETFESGWTEASVPVTEIQASVIR